MRLRLGVALRLEGVNMYRTGERWPTHKGKARHKKKHRKLALAALERESKENTVGFNL